MCLNLFIYGLWKKEDGTSNKQMKKGKWKKTAREKLFFTFSLARMEEKQSFDVIFSYKLVHMRRVMVLWFANKAISLQIPHFYLFHAFSHGSPQTLRKKFLKSITVQSKADWPLNYQCISNSTQQDTYMELKQSILYKTPYMCQEKNVFHLLRSF